MMAIPSPDEEERVAIAEWLTVNGIPPKSVPRYDSGLRIEELNGERFIQYTEYVLSDSGHVQRDPDDPDAVWKQPVSVPCRVEPPGWLNIPGGRP